MPYPDSQGNPAAAMPVYIGTTPVGQTKIYDPQVKTLGQNAVPSSVTNTTDLVTLASFLVPAGTIGPNSSIDIQSVWSFSVSATGKTIRVGFGPANLWSVIVRNSASLQYMVSMANRNVLNSQATNNQNTTMSYSAGAGLTRFTNIDFSVDQVLTFTGQLEVDTDVMTLERFRIQLF